MKNQNEGFNKLKEVINFQNIEKKNNLLSYHRKNKNFFNDITKFCSHNKKANDPFEKYSEYNPVLKYFILNQPFSQIEYIIKQMKINNLNKKINYQTGEIYFEEYNYSYAQDYIIIGTVIKILFDHKNILFETVGNKLINVLNLVLKKYILNEEITKLLCVLLQRKNFTKLYTEFKTKCITQMKLSQIDLDHQLLS